MKRNIDAITIYTNTLSFSSGIGPMTETVAFHRATDSSRSDLSCRSYFVSAQRDSFWRAIRAMRKLSVRKWEKHNPHVEVHVIPKPVALVDLLFGLRHDKGDYLEENANV